MPGAVTDHLLGLVARQVEKDSLVVWYDPDRDYEAAAEAFDLPETTFVKYEGSFLQLRHEIDHLLEGLHPPRLVVYVPLDQGQTHHALVELEAAGVVMKPGQQPPQRNTRLAVVARGVLRDLLGDDSMAEVEKQVVGGQHSLADLDRLADMGRGLSTAGLTLVYEAATPQDIVRRFLTEAALDREVERKSASSELMALLQSTFGLAPADGASLPEMRERLAKHVLMTELIERLGGDVPEALSSVKTGGTPAEIEQCLRLVRPWRNDRELREHYVETAKRIEREFSLEELDFPPELAAEVETFSFLERVLVNHVEVALLRAATPDLLALARSRLVRFWVEVTPSLQARWSLVVAAAEVLLAADRVADSLKNPSDSFQALIEAYAEGDAPWCLLDTHHRDMERRKFDFEYGSDGEHDALDRLIVRAEQRHAEVASALAEHFVRRFHSGGHATGTILRQRNVYETQVRPKLDGGKTAYVWVDALRFEMGRELARLLSDDYEVSLRPCLGTPPTITEIGMAALLPGAHKSATVVDVGGGKLGLQIGGSVLKDRRGRVAFLKQHAGVPVFAAKLDDLLPKPKKAAREGIRDARLVLITSQEIDELGERDSSRQAHLQMAGVLGQLRRAVRVLADQGVVSLVIVADHGHLLGEEVGEDMKIEAPGGRTADLHRRVWVGVGGASEPSYLRVPLSSLGVDSDLDLATPYSLACFKAKGGANAYFHGGLSPQELVVPVITLDATAQSGRSAGGIEWALIPGSAKLSTRFFSVQIEGKQAEAGLFDLEPPRVRLELRANRRIVSTPISATYGFESATGEVALKPSEADGKRVEPDTVTMMVTEDVPQKTVGVYLLDASTGVELTRLDGVEVAISI